MAKIPHKMAGIEITEEQRNKLILGETLHIVGLTDKAGKKYNSYVQQNAVLFVDDYSKVFSNAKITILTALL